MKEDTLSWTKSEGRRSMRAHLRSISDAQLTTWSAEVIERLKAKNTLWDEPGVISLFGGLRNEVDLITHFMPWLRDRGWRTVLFAVKGEALIPHEVHGPHDLHRGPLGIWEPHLHPHGAMPLSRLSVILVPALAFSAADGIRLGRGGGFYDRLLARPEVTARRIGVAFEAQVVPGLTSEPHDLGVHELVTEAHWRCFADS